MVEETLGSLSLQFAMQRRQCRYSIPFATLYCTSWLFASNGFPASDAVVRPSSNCTANDPAMDTRPIFSRRPASPDRPIAPFQIDRDRSVSIDSLIPSFCIRFRTSELFSPRNNRESNASEIESERDRELT